MAKLKSLSRVIRILARNPRRLLKLLDDEADWRDYVVKKHGRAQGLPTIDILDLVPNFEDTINPYSFLDGVSTLTDLALLRALARKMNAKLYFEIGTWRGESVANLATLVEECVSVRLSDDELRQSGTSQAVIDNHQFFSNGLKNVTHIHENSALLDYSPFKKKCDLIFIDGNHSYEYVTTDTRNAFSLLRDDDSVIVWHDYGFNPEIVRWSVLAGILDGSPPEARNRLYHVSNTMCCVYLQRNVSARFVEFPSVPNKSFTIKLQARKV